jgi:hypothetical protein
MGEWGGGFGLGGKFESGIVKLVREQVVRM